MLVDKRKDMSKLNYAQFGMQLWNLTPVFETQSCELPNFHNH